MAVLPGSTIAFSVPQQYNARRKSTATVLFRADTEDSSCWYWQEERESSSGDDDTSCSNSSSSSTGSKPQQTILKQANGDLPPVIQQIADERQEYNMNLGKAMDTLRKDMPEILKSPPGT